MKMSPVQNTEISLTKTEKLVIRVDSSTSQNIDSSTSDSRSVTSFDENSHLNASADERFSSLSPNNSVANVKDDDDHPTLQNVKRKDAVCTTCHDCGGLRYELNDERIFSDGRIAEEELVKNRKNLVVEKNALLSHSKDNILDKTNLHQEHERADLNSEMSEVSFSKNELNVIEKLDLQIPIMKSTLCEVEKVSLELQAKKNATEAKVLKCFDDLREILLDRQRELLSKLHSHHESKQRVLDSQKQELEQWITEAEFGRNDVEKTETLIENSNNDEEEHVLIKRKLIQEINSLADVEFPQFPRENSNVQFCEGNIDSVKNSIAHAGKIQTTSAVPHQTTAMGDFLRKVLVDRMNVVTVVTRNHAGTPIKHGGSNISAFVYKIVTTPHRKSESDAAIMSKQNKEHERVARKDVSDVEVLDVNDGTYEIYFRVRSIGTYHLEIYLNGQHISASPFVLNARMPTAEISRGWSETSSYFRGSFESIRKKSPMSTMSSQTSRKSGCTRQSFSHHSSCSMRTLHEPIEDDLIMKVGKKGCGKGEFANPQGICFAPVKDGRILVADSNNQCVQVFDSNGQFKIRFGVRGRRVGQIQRPTGVAFLPTGNYAVADYENRWISIFEPTGKFVSRFGQGKLLGPKGLGVSKEGHIIVVDNKASSVLIFHTSGKLIHKFGNRAVTGYNFAGPHFCAVNACGDIIVTDFHNHCVRVFSNDGVAKFSFGSMGEGNGQFNAPTGIAVDTNQNIIVADWGNSRIQVFDGQGSFLSFVNTSADPLYGPQGLSLTPAGNIMVADSGSHCFKIYKYLQ